MKAYRGRRERKRAHAGSIPGHKNEIEPALLAKGGAVRSVECRRDGGHVHGGHGSKHLGKRARGGKWIGAAREQMEKKGTVGALHRELHVPEGEKIPEKKLGAAKRRAERAGNTTLERRVQFAENVRK